MAFFDRLFAVVRAFLGEPLDKSLRRRLRAAAPASIAELREGLHCRISGTVRALDQATLEAPLSGVPCVAYLLEVVEDRVTAGPMGTDRDLVVYDRRAVPFLLIDGDHRAVIDPDHAQILLRFEHELVARSPVDLDARARAVLARFVPDRKDWNRTTRIRFRESVVEVGVRVAIAGVGTREADPLGGSERGYRDQIQQRLRFAGSAHLPLLIGRDPP